MQNENFYTQNQSVFLVQSQMKTPPKKGLHSDLVRFLAQIYVMAKKKKVFAYRMYAQTFGPSYKGGAMPQFSILFYANYTIQETQKGSHGQMSPLNKYAMTPCHLQKSVENMIWSCDK